MFLSEEKNQKTFDCWRALQPGAHERRMAVRPTNQSLFASFSSEKDESYDGRWSGRPPGADRRRPDGRGIGFLSSGKDESCGEAR
jgi:hypothetical protein